MQRTPPTLATEKGRVSPVEICETASAGSSSRRRPKGPSRDKVAEAIAQVRARKMASSLAGSSRLSVDTYYTESIGSAGDSGLSPQRPQQMNGHHQHLSPGQYMSKLEATMSKLETQLSAVLTPRSPLSNKSPQQDFASPKSPVLYSSPAHSSSSLVVPGLLSCSDEENKPRLHTGDEQHSQDTVAEDAESKTTTTFATAIAASGPETAAEGGVKSNKTSNSRFLTEVVSETDIALDPDTLANVSRFIDNLQQQNQQKLAHSLQLERPDEENGAQVLDVDPETLAALGDFIDTLTSSAVPTIPKAATSSATETPSESSAELNPELVDMIGTYIDAMADLRTMTDAVKEQKLQDICTEVQRSDTGISEGDLGPEHARQIEAFVRDYFVKHDHETEPLPPDTIANVRAFIDRLQERATRSTPLPSPASTRMPTATTTTTTRPSNRTPSPSTGDLREKLQGLRDRAKAIKESAALHSPLPLTLSPLRARKDEVVAAASPRATSKLEIPSFQSSETSATFAASTSPPALTQDGTIVADILKPATDVAFSLDRSQDQANGVKSHAETNGANDKSATLPTVETGLHAESAPVDTGNVSFASSSSRWAMPDTGRSTSRRSIFDFLEEKKLKEAGTSSLAPRYDPPPHAGPSIKKDPPLMLSPSEESLRRVTNEPEANPHKLPTSEAQCDKNFTPAIDPEFAKSLAYDMSGELVRRESDKSTPWETGETNGEEATDAVTRDDGSTTRGSSTDAMPHTTDEHSTSRSETYSRQEGSVSDGIGYTTTTTTEDIQGKASAKARKKSRAEEKKEETSDEGDAEHAKAEVNTKSERVSAMVLAETGQLQQIYSDIADKDQLTEQNYYNFACFVQNTFAVFAHNEPIDTEHVRQEGHRAGVSRNEVDRYVELAAVRSRDSNGQPFLDPILSEDLYEARVRGLVTKDPVMSFLEDIATSFQNDDCEYESPRSNEEAPVEVDYHFGVVSENLGASSDNSFAGPWWEAAARLAGSNDKYNIESVDEKPDGTFNAGDLYAVKPDPTPMDAPASGIVSFEEEYVYDGSNGGSQDKQATFDPAVKRAESTESTRQLNQVVDDVIFEGLRSNSDEDDVDVFWNERKEFRERRILRKTRQGKDALPSVNITSFSQESSESSVDSYTDGESVEVSEVATAVRTICTLESNEDQWIRRRSMAQWSRAMAWKSNQTWLGNKTTNVPVNEPQPIDATAMANHIQNVTLRQHKYPLQRHWKRPERVRTRGHGGYMNVDVYSLYENSVVVTARHPLDDKPWEHRDVKQKFLYEQSIQFRRNWFGSAPVKSLNPLVRMPVCRPRSMQMPMKVDEWNDDWYMKPWQAPLQSALSGESRIFVREDSRDEGHWQEVPECGHLRNVKLRIGERLTLVTPELTCSLRRSRFRKRHFPRGTFPY